MVVRYKSKYNLRYHTQMILKKVDVIMSFFTFFRPQFYNLPFFDSQLILSKWYIHQHYQHVLRP